MAVSLKSSLPGFSSMRLESFSLINRLIKRKSLYFKFVKNTVNWLPRKDPHRLTSYCRVYLEGVWSIIAFSGHNIFVPSDHRI